MPTTNTGFAHTSVERLCDYELPAQPTRASPTTPASSKPGDPGEADDTQNLALNWWLWMDGMSKNMWRHYDAWREQLDQASRKGPTNRG